jgi:hypothetical protein
MAAAGFPLDRPDGKARDGSDALNPSERPVAKERRTKSESAQRRTEKNVKMRPRSHDIIENTGAGPKKECRTNWQRTPNKAVKPPEEPKY